ncbi:VOC family protein [Geodermatophilus sp. TF02-6]|uniref:VOC family protein n=1 Tax=Geodermatophilus sp. TF02-6 TaxID=2250575 RepID=UPI000DEA3AE8|nr:VOC family protein [Geodermatophilus sp. TF02-6]RBY75234.1 VOC family protein [Geodermatophilus sp. TF02-6]
MTDSPAEVRASPVLPVADLDRSLDHYRALGFLVSRHDDRYGFAAWAGLELHLAVVPGHDPERTAATVFLHVPDADAVATAWADVDRTSAPEDRPWGIREGRHVDLDGNLLRFGSPVTSPG